MYSNRPYNNRIKHNTIIYNIDIIISYYAQMRICDIVFKQRFKRDVATHNQFRKLNLRIVVFVICLLKRVCDLLIRGQRTRESNF